MGKKRDFTERAKSGPGKASKKQTDPKLPKAFGKQGLLKMQGRLDLFDVPCR